MENLNLDINKAVQLILNKMYFSEFEIIEGLSQHPQGMNFYEWLFAEDLISAEKLNEITAEIESEYKDNPEPDYDNMAQDAIDDEYYAEQPTPYDP